MASYLLRTILCLNLVASVSYLVFKASAFAGRKHISEKWRYNCTTVIMFLYVIPFYKLLPAFPKTLAEAEPISVVGNKVVSGINVLPPENSVASITEASPNIIKDTTLTVTTCNVKGERVTIKKDKAKNKSSLRTYPLIPFLKERLLEAKKQQEENRKLCGRSYNKEYLGYVCVDVIGNLIKPNYVSSTFGKLLAKNNLRHIRFHDLRHTCASLLLANGVPMEQVKEWLGHSEISTTVDIYGHLQYATKKQSAAAIEQDIVAPMLQNLSAVSP